MQQRLGRLKPTRPTIRHGARLRRSRPSEFIIIRCQTASVIVRCSNGSQHLISRTETSASFDAHVTRLSASPHKTFGNVALEPRNADGVGAGHGYYEMDTTIAFEIAKVLELTAKEALISFMDNELNARWFRV